MEIKNRPNRNEASHTGKTLLAQRLLEKYKNVAFAAILLFGACVFTACSKDDDEEVLGVDTTSRVDKYKDMESLVESPDGCQHHRCVGLAGNGEGYCRCHPLQ